MGVIFGSLKYIFKNFWYVLPCALLPAVFLTLSMDYTNIGIYVRAFFTGDPRLNFLDLFCVWNIFHYHSALSVVYSVCAFLSVIIFASVLFPLVEKHMRIGRRTPNGIWEGFKSALLPVFSVALLYFVFYQIFILILSSLLFAVNAIPNTAAVYILSIVVYGLLFFAFFYVLTVFYLWLPCKLMTGFSVSESFRYSYRLAVSERGKLMLSFVFFYAVTVAVFALTALLPVWVRYLVSFVLYALLFLDFCIRMETVYFKADKLDREDIVHSFKEY